ncbi:MAG TPA: hypothetical protein VFR11_07615 [Micromonosporaceae bacterium]|jgi:hypothetical protein|nr:hypothetical protein [Micromonosporaceae bacterium]
MSDPAAPESGVDAPTKAESADRGHRRQWIAAIAAAAVVALVVTLIVVANQPPGPVTTADARRAGVPVVVGDTLFRPDGTTTTLKLPGGDIITQLAVVPGGVVALVDHQGPDDAGVAVEVRLIPSDGGWEQLARPAENAFAVTSDGRTVVAASGGAGIALESIDVTTRRTLQLIGGNWSVAALNGDWALLRSNSDDYVWRDSKIWNVRTGMVVPFATSYGVTPLGVTPSGGVLRAVASNPSVQPNEPSPACLDVVAATGTGAAAAVPTTPSGYCGMFDLVDATVSPDGVWAVLIPRTVTAGHGVVAVRTADLHAGRWAPVNLDQADGVSRPLFWDSPTSFIAPFTNDSSDTGVERCSVDGRCHDFVLPANAVVGQSIGS